MTDDQRTGGILIRARRLLGGLRFAAGSANAVRAAIPQDYEVASPVFDIPHSTATSMSADELYLAFENVFYDHETVVGQFRLDAQLLAAETPVVDGRRTVVDLGAGRGELLEQLQSAGLEATGVEMNATEVAMARDSGLSVALSDAVSFLSGLDDRRLGAATLIQVVEHLQPEYFLQLARLLADKVADGGVVIIETVNSKCLSVHGTFWLDISHVRMYPVETVWFYLQAAGFSRARVIYRAPVSHGYRIPEDPAANYGNYALVAYK